MKENQTYLLLAMAAVFWGVQPLCVKVIVKEWSPAALTSARYLLVSGTLFLVMRLRGETRILPPRRCVLPLLIMGLTGIAINNVAQFTGLQYSTVTNCTLIAATNPAFTALCAAIFLRERLNYLQWLGIAISFFGIAFLVARGDFASLLHISLNFGDVLFFVCQLNWVAYSLVGLRVMRSMSAIAATAWAGLFGAAFVLVYGVLQGELNFAPLSLSAAGAFVYTVFLGGVVSMLCWNIGVKNAGPSLSAIFSNLTPVVGMGAGALFLGEIIGMEEFTGAAAIFGGVYLTTHSKKFVNHCYGVHKGREVLNIEGESNIGPKK